MSQPFLASGPNTPLSSLSYLPFSTFAGIKNCTSKVLLDRSPDFKEIFIQFTPKQFIIFAPVSLSFIQRFYI